jgi:hypothetical protein
VGRNLHAFFHRRDAGGQQLGCSLDFDQAQAARPDLGQALQFAKSGNENIILPSDVQDGFLLPGADIAVVDLQGFDVAGGSHRAAS